MTYITIATVSDSGDPWNSPVACFHFNDDYVFYWASWQENQHSRNIRANNKAFIAVFDSTPSNGQPTEDVYIQAKAYCLTPPTINT
jgi:Pyridoxamine 5'-phosphate oxidase